MKKYHVKREFLRMEQAIVKADNEDSAIELAQQNGQFDPYWNQDEDWQYTAEEIKSKSNTALTNPLLNKRLPI